MKAFSQALGVRPIFPNPFVTQKVIKLGDKIYVNLNLKPEITFGVTRMIYRCCNSVLLVSDSNELQHGLTSVIKIKYTILTKWNMVWLHTKTHAATQVTDRLLETSSKPREYIVTLIVVYLAYTVYDGLKGSLKSRTVLAQISLSKLSFSSARQLIIKWFIST